VAGGVSEVAKIKIAHLSTADIFDENKVDAIYNLTDFDKVVIWSKRNVVIHMSHVEFMTWSEDELTIYFTNNSRLTVRRNGEVIFEPTLLTTTAINVRE